MMIFVSFILGGICGMVFMAMFAANDRKDK